MKIIVLASLAESLINFRGPLIREFVKAGHEVYGCAPGGNPDIAKKLACIGALYRPTTLERTGMNPVRDARSLLDLRRLIKEIGPDVILSYTIKPVIFGSICARSAGVKRIYSIITGLGFAFSGETFKQRAVNCLVTPLYRLALSLNEKVFFQNPDDRELFIEKSIIPDRRKTVLLNGSGVDMDRFAPAPCKTDPISFLLIARLIKDKGIFEFVEAATLLKSRHPEVSFRVLGPFETGPAGIKESQMDEWMSSGVIEYLGETDDVRPYIAGASVYVLPSYREGVPRSVLEAMAMGRPVVTTDAPGCRETVKEGENGFMVPVKDSRALGAAMERFITDPGLVERFGKKSLEIIEERFDIRKVNARVLEEMEL